MKKKQPVPFRLSVKEQKGLILLTTLIVLLFAGWQLYRQLPPQVDASQSRAFQAAWIAFKEAQTGGVAKEAANSETPTIHLEVFDPNLADQSTLLQLGLPARTVNILLNYRRHGGRFRTKEDLKKIYTLTAADYNKLAPYIRIRKAAVEPSPSARKQQPEIIELNTTTAGTLSQLAGIDYKLAKRLLAFRDYLGGFHTVEQILELHGFPDNLFSKLEKQLRVSKSQLRQINLNEASSAQLEDHPYITRRMAESLYSLKTRLGRIDSVEQIKQLTLINDENYRKIAPYLKTAD